MKLCDADIEKHLDAGILKINPRPEASRITGASVDLTLSGKFRIFDYHAAPVIDLGGPRAELDAQVERITRAEVNIPEGEAFYLHPGELALGVTIEEVELPDNIAGWINGRSSPALPAALSDRTEARGASSPAAEQMLQQGGAGLTIGRQAIVPLIGGNGIGGAWPRDPVSGPGIISRPAKRSLYIFHQRRGRQRNPAF